MGISKSAPLRLEGFPIKSSLKGGWVESGICLVGEKTLVLTQL